MGQSVKVRHLLAVLYFLSQYKIPPPDTVSALIYVKAFVVIVSAL